MRMIDEHGKRPWHSRFEKVVLKDGTVRAVWIGTMHRDYPENCNREGLNACGTGLASADHFREYNFPERIPFALMHKSVCDLYFVGVGCLPQDWEDSKSCWGTTEWPWLHVFHGDYTEALAEYEVRLAELVRLSAEEVG